MKMVRIMMIIMMIMAIEEVKKSATKTQEEEEEKIMEKEEVEVQEVATGCMMITWCNNEMSAALPSPLPTWQSFFQQQ